MSKNTNGEYFDGLPVTAYEGGFSGRFDIDEEAGLRYKHNDVIWFLVAASVGTGNFSETKDGDIKRVNKFPLMSTVELSPALATKVQDEIYNPKPSVIIQDSLDYDEDDYANS